MIIGRQIDNSRRWQSWLLAEVTAVIFLLLILWPESFGFENDPSSVTQLGELLPHVPVALIGSFFLFSALIVLFGVLRWRTLLRAQGIDLPVSFLVRSWLAGAFLHAGLSTVIARDLWRWYDASRLDNAPRMGAVIIVEKCVGLVAFALLLIAGAAFYVYLDVPLAKLRTALVLGGALAVIVLAIAFVFYPRLLQVTICFVPTKRLRSFLGQFAASVAVYRDRPGAIAMALLWSLALRLSFFALVVTMMSAVRPATVSWTEQAPGWLTLSSLTILGYLPREPLSLRAGIELWLGPLGEFPGREAFHTLVWWAQHLLPVSLGALALIIGTRRGVAPSTLPRLPALAPSDEMVREATRRVALGTAAGAGAGLLAGAVAGIAEAIWIDWHILQQAQDWQLYWWAPLVYGLAFLAAGMGIGGVLATGGLVLYRRFSVALVSAGAFALVLAGVMLVVGRYRFARDILGDQPLELSQMAGLAGLALATAAVTGLALYLVLRMSPRRLRLCMPVSLWLVALLASAGVSMSKPVTEPDLASRASSIEVTSSSPDVAGAEPTGSMPEAPNVILIIVDTLRADYLRLYNPDAVARTPHLDAFAQEAVLFRHSYAQAPWTKPSFGTIFTGVYPSVHGAVGKSSVLPEKFATLAEHLRDAGYHTAGFPNNRNIATWAGFAQGFAEYHELDADRYFGATPTTEMLAGYLVLRQLWLQWSYPRINVSHFYQPAERVNTAVGEWLAEPRPSDATHLFIHYMDPHDPYRSADVPGEAYAYTVMGYHLDPEQWSDLLERSYIKEIEYFDQYLGELMLMLRGRGLYENSLILLTSDHGEELYDHQGWCHGDTLYEEQLHVPLLIKLPQETAGGAVNENIARHVDLLPTVLRLVGLREPAGLPGVPLLAADGAPLNAETEHSFAEVDFLGTIAESLRDKHQKLIETQTTKRPHVESREFFDLQVDPKEQVNRAEDPRAGKAAEDLDRIRSGEVQQSP
jgi:arylsulfatase A-like enzyme